VTVENFRLWSPNATRSEIALADQAGDPLCVCPYNRVRTRSRGQLSVGWRYRRPAASINDCSQHGSDT
jgi:hypothetical protein